MTLNKIEKGWAGMSELADRIRARNAAAAAGADDWFRKEEAEAADAAATRSDGSPSQDDSDDTASRVFVLPSTHLEEARDGVTAPAQRADDSLVSAGRHALARKAPFWLARPCPAWCQSDHTEADRPADRRHLSAPLGSVVLTETEAAESSDGSWQAQDIHVALSQHVREVEPLISCGGHGPAGAWRLTVAEARELAAALTRAVEAAERY
jgi:hypothetical protein